MHTYENIKQDASGSYLFDAYSEEEQAHIVEMSETFWLNRTDTYSEWISEHTDRPWSAQIEQPYFTSEDIPHHTNPISMPWSWGDHSHSIVDPGHCHTVIDPGHTHGVSRPLRVRYSFADLSIAVLFKLTFAGVEH